MKILYVTDYRDIARASGGFINDYMNDLLFYGLRELYGDGVVDSTPIISLYKEYETQIDFRNLWGGMTSFWLIGENNIDRTAIEEKIESNYYDFIIYGAWRRCKQYYDLATKYYTNNKIILIDGNDESDLDNHYLIHPYFKRELTENYKTLFPISFAIPTCKLASPYKNKIKDYGTVIPGEPSTYIFKSELDYYKDYQNSFYGVTMKKAGWDCMRHYEILGNYCMPYFLKLEECPYNTLTFLPKKSLINARDLANNFNIRIYYELLDEMFEYTKTKLTTKALAEYVISKI